MSSTLLAVRQILSDANIIPPDYESSYSCHIGSEPENPINVVTLFESGGGTPAYSQLKRKDTLQYKNFQVRVRSSNYLEGSEKLDEIRDELEEQSRYIFLDGFEYRIFTVTTDTYTDKTEDDQHFLFINNFEVQRIKL